MGPKASTSLSGYFASGAGYVSVGIMGLLRASATARFSVFPLQPDPSPLAGVFALAMQIRLRQANSQLPVHIPRI